MVSRPWHKGLPKRKRVCDVRTPEGVLCNVLVYAERDGEYRKVRVCGLTEDGRDATMVVALLESQCEWQWIEVPGGV